MNPPHSDVLVLLRVTGDLIHRRILPALYAIERPARLKVPINRADRSLLFVTGSATGVNGGFPGPPANRYVGALLDRMSPNKY